MFPKAHAAAYVMMAWRDCLLPRYFILCLLLAFFSIRASGAPYVTVVLPGP